MKTKSTFAKLAALALLMTAAMVYAANRSGASGVSAGYSSAATTEQPEFIPATETSTGIEPQTGAPELRGYKPVQAERLPLAIHGPFVVTMEETARKRTERKRPQRDNGDEDSDGDDPDNDKNGSPCTNPAKCGGAAGGDGPAKNVETPPTDKTWDAVIDRNGGGGSDPQIAAGPSYLLTTMRDEITFLDKNGNVVSKDKNGKPFKAGQTQTIDFFGKLTDDINAHLNLPAGFTVGQGYGIDTYYDARSIYDSYRQRYWIVALAINNKTPCARQKDGKPSDWQCNPLLSGARRAKVVVGVSSTSDPRDNWSLYWWDATPHDGQCGLDPMCLVTEHGADYPSLGISEKYLLVEHGAGSKIDSYRYVSIAPADALANGASCNNCNFTGGWAYWHIKNPNGSYVNLLQPAVHHGKGYPNWSFFAGNYQSQGQSYQISMVFVDAAKSLFYSTTAIKSYAFPTNALQPQMPPGVLKPFQLKISNVGNGMMKAAFRDGKLYSTFQDCKLWPGANQCVTSIRVLRVDVSNPAAPEIDRTFGQRNVSDPAKVDLVSYATPAVEVNKHGNIVLVYMRSGANLFPEARYSVYAANGSDISPSKVLRAGGSSLGGDCVKNNGAANCPAAIGNLDVGGISVDGGDDEGIWMAHGYVNGSGQMKIAVGKIFGK
jgi:hypothetical protein